MVKVAAIFESPRLRTKTKVGSFLGFVGWYRQFIPHFSTLSAPLTNLTCISAPSHVPWNEECDMAFQSLKDELGSTSVLHCLDFERLFLRQVVASGVGIGAVGEEYPVMHLSRKLLSRETRYSTIEKECLAMKWVLDSLQYYMLGREFDIPTNHRA